MMEAEGLMMLGTLLLLVAPACRSPRRLAVPGLILITAAIILLVLIPR